MRTLLPILGPLLLCLAAALPAFAEEVFILDNGNVVRGRVVREDEEQVVVRLAGFAVENRITLKSSEIVRRFLSVDPHQRPGMARATQDPTSQISMLGTHTGVPHTTLIASDLQQSARIPVGAPGDLPTGEVSMEEEGFFARLRRVCMVAMPESLEARLLLGFLLLVVMTVMVAGGTRMLGMKAASLHASSSLGLVLGTFLVADILWSASLLRADRAVWILPLQALVWLGVARSTLDAPLSRTVPLFAMVLFASTCFVFATGSLLVSV